MNAPSQGVVNGGKPYDSKTKKRAPVQTPQTWTREGMNDQTPVLLMVWGEKDNSLERK